MPLLRFIILSLLSCVSACVYSQNGNYQFARIGMRNGLSHPMVNDIIKDSNGLMWFATSSGLNRFDGYSIKVYRNIPGDSSSLQVDDVTRLFEGPDSLMWMYSLSGNAIYDPRTDIFHSNTRPFLKSLSVIEGLITSIKKDSEGNFWFLHFNMGLFKYNPTSKTTDRLKHNESDTTSIATQSLAGLVESSDGYLWLVHQNGIVEKIDQQTLKVVYRNNTLQQRYGTERLEYKVMIDSDNDLWICSDKTSGIFFLDHQTSTFQNFNTNSRIKLSSGIVRNIIQDDQGYIWVGTGLDGVNIINKKDFSVTYLRNNKEDEKTVSDNSIQSMYKDNEGIMWIGTYKNGVSLFHTNIFRFRAYKAQKSSPGNLPSAYIQSLAEGKDGTIWMGTDGGGLIAFNRKEQKFRQYLHNPKDPRSLSSNVIISMWADADNSLWLGTYAGGLEKFNGGSFTHYRHQPLNAKSLGDDNVWEIHRSTDGYLWLGTLKAGIDVLDPKKEEFTHYHAGDDNSIHSPYVPAIMEDDKGNLWFGTGYGLEVYIRNSNRFVHYLHDVKNPSSLSSNRILSLLQDSRGLIWIGTQSGLNLFDPVKKEFRSFQLEAGLRQNIILTLVEDDNKNLWMSTPNGLTKMIVNNGPRGYTFEFLNYDESDGLINGFFNENAVLKCTNGELFFGGSDGFNVFNPKLISMDTTRPKVIFTDFKVFNRSAKIGESINDNVVLSKALGYQKEITLKPSNNFFSVSFAALNYFHPEKSRYRYLMENFHQDWIMDGGHREATFTNLDPGVYTLRVQASNSDGLWTGETAVLKITVLPPFWKSNVAFLLYTLFFGGALLTVRWLIVIRERMNFKLEQQKIEVERIKALDEMKINFFTNVSHEFLTPLALILTPTERLLSKAKDAEDKNSFQLILRNARRLQHLVNQLLDLRKIEVQSVKLNLAQGDMVAFVEDLAYSFVDLSEKKHIRLTFRSAVPELVMAFDPDKVEKIVFNLLYNAFKFTPENGEVSVLLALDPQEAFVKLDITDTGIGIPSDKLDKIFERFFQNEMPASIVNPGSGIGLSITYEFVKMHGGFITVHSEQGKGSCFTVLLPVTLQQSNVANSPAVTVSMEEENEEAATELEIANKKPVLLLAEDHEDFRAYLRDNLKDLYTVIEASNGKEAWQEALTSIPDMIVSDVIMPEMNGVELCRKLKSETSTSHVPVILLTAKNSDEQEMEGLQSGADDYITKPFNFDVLQSRIKNLIEQRKVFQKQFSKHLDIKASEIQITSLDEKFMHEAIAVVEENLGNKEFSVKAMSRTLAVSRVLLYKKMLSLTGKTPSEFIRAIRLQRAAQLLEKTQYAIAEVAFQVGYNDPKIFARHFKEHYNMLPSVYAASRKASAMTPVNNDSTQDAG